MCKSLLGTGTVKTPAMTDVALQQFTPFLTARTFAGNTNSFPMTNLDSMLVHSLAYMLYGNNNVSATPTAYGLAATMPTKYLGPLSGRKPPIIGIFAVGTGSITLALPTPSTPVLASSIQGLASGRTYVPSHFDLTGFNHGQNFLGSAAAAAHTATMIFTDTNWIDPGTGCPTYWQIDAAGATRQEFTVETTAAGVVQKHSLGGLVPLLPPPTLPPTPTTATNRIYIMDNK
jgi:hypothetical protein